MNEKEKANYIRLGMMYQCASYFDVDIHSKCVSDIVDTYINDKKPFPFFDWIRGYVIVKNEKEYYFKDGVKNEW